MVAERKGVRRLETKEPAHPKVSPKEELLWKAVIYLSGVGLKISPNKYMEDEIGIKEMFSTYWNQ